jgi:hypothetical protein
LLGLIKAVSYVIGIFIVGLAAAVFPRLLNGGISTRNLLHGRGADGSIYFSPGRVQLLLFTVWTALTYLLNVISNRGDEKLPDIPLTTLALLGGSHAIYLGGKAYSILFSKSPKGGE